MGFDSSHFSLLFLQVSQPVRTFGANSFFRVSRFLGAMWVTFLVQTFANWLSTSP